MKAALRDGTWDECICLFDLMKLNKIYFLPPLFLMLHLHNTWRPLALRRCKVFLPLVVDRRVRKPDTLLAFLQVNFL
jgi:hypothetical protein